MSPRAANLFGHTLEQLEGRTLLAAVPLGISQVSYLGGLQLKITGTSGNDQITVKKTVAGLVVGNTGGWSSTVAGTFKSIWIDGGAGDDSIALDASVTQDAIIYGSAGNDTITGGSGNDRIYGGDNTDILNGGAGNDVLVSIGGGQLDTLTGGLGTDSFWTDTTDTITDPALAENAIGSVHKIGTFLSETIASKITPISKELLKQNLPDPVATGTSYITKNFSTNPLFSDAGPVANDVNQGYVGDCYFLSTLSSIAKVDPTLIRQSIADLGDGTYAVQFVRGGVKTFVRVDADLATYSWGGLVYANTGAQGSLWVALMEKAFTFFRTGAGTYASISSGWMSEVYSDFGKTSSSNYFSSSATWLLTTAKKALDAGQSVTYAVGTPGSAPLIGSHAYMVVSVTLDSTGKPKSMTLRNPWGIDGAGNDGANDGYVTITGDQAQAAFMGMSCAVV